VCACVCEGKTSLSLNHHDRALSDVRWLETASASAAWRAPPRLPRSPSRALRVARARPEQVRSENFIDTERPAGGQAGPRSGERGRGQRSRSPTVARPLLVSAHRSRHGSAGMAERDVCQITFKKKMWRSVGERGRTYGLQLARMLGPPASIPAPSSYWKFGGIATPPPGRPYAQLSGSAATLFPCPIPRADL